MTDKGLESAVECARFYRLCGEFVACVNMSPEDIKTRSAEIKGAFKAVVAADQVSQSTVNRDKYSGMLRQLSAVAAVVGLTPEQFIL